MFHIQLFIIVTYLPKIYNRDISFINAKSICRYKPYFLPYCYNNNLLKGRMRMHRQDYTRVRKHCDL